jgi:BON domain
LFAQPLLISESGRTILPPQTISLQPWQTYQPSISYFPTKEEKTMKRILAAICGVLLMSAVALAQAAQPAQGGEMMKKSEKKEKKAKAAAPTSDADIQKCISDKLANSEKLKSQGFSATVSGGAATLTGTAANAGSKGAATRIAQSCGAKEVTNNITAPPVAKPAKKSEKKEEKKG